MCSEYICEGAAEGPTCLLSEADSHSMLVLQTCLYLLTEGKGGLFVPDIHNFNEHCAHKTHPVAVI